MSASAEYYTSLANQATESVLEGLRRSVELTRVGSRELRLYGRHAEADANDLRGDRYLQLLYAASTVFHAADTGQMVWAAEHNVPTADEAFDAGYSAALDDDALTAATAADALPGVLGDAYSDRMAVTATNPTEVQS